MPHEAHPRCASCGKALYKSLMVGTRVKKADPYRWCRNTSCDRYKEQSNSAPAAMERQKAMTGPKRGAARRARGRPAKKAPPKPKPFQEAEPIRKARQRIRGLLSQVGKEHPALAIHLVLAIVNQETGNTKAANAIIEEHGLKDHLRQF